MIISPTRPERFAFVEVTEENRSRGITIKNPKTQANEMMGEKTDIQKYVQHYFFSEETGELQVYLESKNRLHYKLDQLKHRMVLDSKASESAIYAIDAVLNQLAMATFLVFDGQQEKTVGLLRGEDLDKGYVESVPGFSWYREYYDDQHTKKIDFKAIADFAFPNHSYKCQPDGHYFSLQLKEEYKGNPYVLYALHKVLGEKCEINRKLQ